MVFSQLAHRILALSLGMSVASAQTGPSLRLNPSPSDQGSSLKGGDSRVRKEIRKRSKSNQNQAGVVLWPVIPFLNLGDMGQYELTVSRDRDLIRKSFWGELTSSLERLVQQGAPAEVLLEPMARLLILFDQLQIDRKAQDALRVDQSLEAQFKANLDSLYRMMRIQPEQRRLVIGTGPSHALFQNQIRVLSSGRPVGAPLLQSDIHDKLSSDILDEVDVIGYGTFSHLGRGRFQLTFHMISQRDGIHRSFISTGSLNEALQDLARQVFDSFQRQVYAEPVDPQPGLSWLPMPVNPNRGGYTWEEAQTFCRSRGYRLPLARELIMAEAQGPYKAGGIDFLDPDSSYPVADQRFTVGAHTYAASRNSATGGPIQSAASLRGLGKFWCVKGELSDDVKIFETIWDLIRQFHPKDPEIYRALETIRFYISDYGADGLLYYSPQNMVLKRMDSLEQALTYLRSRGISLQIPKMLRSGVESQK
jgi:hypothetical protein